MIRVQLSRSLCEWMLSEGAMSVETLARLSSPVEKRQSGIGESWIIEAAPAEWDEVALWAYRNSQVPPGSRKSAETRAIRAQRILGRVEENLRRLSLHPAYQSRAVKARSAVVLPAFRCKHPRARWWPTPAMALRNAEGDSLEMESGWLVPEVKQVRGWTVTKWRLDTNSPAYYGLPATPTVKRAK